MNENVVNEATETVEKVAETVTETATAVAPAVQKTVKGNNMKANAIAIAAGFAGGIAAIAIVKPAWRLTKKAANAGVNLVKKPFHKKDAAQAEAPVQEEAKSEAK